MQVPLTDAEQDLCEVITEYALSGSTDQLKDGLQYPKIKFLMQVLRINNKTLAHVACLQENIQLLNICVTANVDLNDVDDENNTPLHLAAKKGHLQAIQILLNQDVDLLVKNKNGQTPSKVARDQNHTEAAVLINEKIMETRQKEQLALEAERKHLLRCIQLLRSQSPPADATDR